LTLKNRLLITGTPGSGKSSAIRALSDTAPKVSNIYENSPHLAPSGAGAVMLDYGEMFIDEDHKLEIYATPGQRRFQFMWRTLARQAMGVIVMIDNRRPNPIGDMRIYLDNFSDILDPRSIVVGVNYHGVPGGPRLEEYVAACADLGWVAPMVAVDPRDKADNLYLLAALLAHSSGR
jgi:signal recognition particle receptor subunit beta